DSLKVHATKINERRLFVIGSSEDYLQKLAEPSHKEWTPMLESGFVSKSERDATGISNAHKKNLDKSYNDYTEKLDTVFETVDGVEAKRFKEAIDNSKHIWARAVTEGVLRFTGDKIRGRGPAVIAPYWMTDYAKAEAMLREGDVAIEGAPYNIAYNGQRTAFRAAIQQKLIQAGMQILHSDFNTAMIDAQNSVIRDILNNNSDPVKRVAFVYPYDPASSFCGYVSNGPVFYLKVRILIP
ncbi:MAG: hypothetical protein QME51_05985, partial [Planctomycetota bacterium]|nr:hypothetical protein [Planctomycetota bacterium]